jgi:hypothetical protein
MLVAKIIALVLDHCAAIYGAPSSLFSVGGFFSLAGFHSIVFATKPFAGPKIVALS